MDSFVRNNNVFGYFDCSSSSTGLLFLGYVLWCIFRQLIMSHRWSLQMYSCYMVHTEKCFITSAISSAPLSLLFGVSTCVFCLLLTLYNFLLPVLIHVISPASPCKVSFVSHFKSFLKISFLTWKSNCSLVHYTRTVQRKVILPCRRF